MNQLKIKKCTASDFDTLRELSIQTFYETFAPLNTPQNMDTYLETAFHVDRLRKALNDPHSEFYFLYRNDQLAGYLKLNEAPSQTEINDLDSLEIERIYIASDFQGMGLGRYLMAHACKIAIARNKHYIWLGVWEKNEKAIRFYKQNGFYEIGSHTFVIGVDAQTDYIMKKDL